MNERVAPTIPSSADRKPVTDLRAWLDRLAGSNRLAVARPGVNLRFELAAIAKKLDGEKATFFPRPGGHAIPVISGLTSDRGWMAEAMGVTNDRLLATFQDAALNPLPWREVAAAPAQEVVHREVDLARLLPIPSAMPIIVSFLRTKSRLTRFSLPRPIIGMRQSARRRSWPASMSIAKSR